LPMLDLFFQIQGTTFPVDHGYPLYSAISKICPALHANNGGAELKGSVGIHPVHGRYIGNRQLALTDQSRLAVRIPHEDIVKFMILAGKRICVDGHWIRIGIPSPFLFSVSSALISHLVVIKGYMEEDRFLQAVRDQLEKLEIKGNACIGTRKTEISVEGRQDGAGKGQPLRRTLNIKGREIVGFSVIVEKLSPEGSIQLQERGIGGRRRFGCGIFTPMMQEDKP